MRLLIKDRGQGKTTQMIYTSEATGYPIVVETEGQKRNLMSQAKDMGVIIPEPITINDIELGRLRGFRIEKVIIDEGYNIIEKALNKYIGCNIIAVTLTDRIKEKTQLQLQNKIQELLEENSKLKEKLENQTIINTVQHNARSAGRKPMSEKKLLLLDSLLKQGKKEQEICELMNISRATFYRVKKLATNKPKN